MISGRETCASLGCGDWSPRNEGKQKSPRNHALGFPIGLSAPRGGSIDKRRGHTEARTTGGATQPNFIIRKNERQGHGADGHSSRRTQARACAHRSVIRRAGRRGQGKRRERRRRGRAGVSAKPRLILTVRRHDRQGIAEGTGARTGEGLARSGKKRRMHNAKGRCNATRRT